MIVCFVYAHIAPCACMSEKTVASLMFVDCKERANERLEVYRKEEINKETRYRIKALGEKLPLESENILLL